METFTTIALTAVDVDSPLDETLMTAIRNNIQHNYQWLGEDYTPASNHDHDGVNSALLPGNVVAAQYNYHRFL